MLRRIAASAAPAGEDVTGTGGPSDPGASGTSDDNALEGPTLEGPGLESDLDALLPGDDEDTVSELTIPKVAREHLKYVADGEADPDATNRLGDEEGALARAVDEAVEELRGAGVDVRAEARIEIGELGPAGLRPATDSTQEVSETDIREALSIGPQAPPQGSPTLTAESALTVPAAPVTPPGGGGRTVRLTTLVAVTLVSSFVAAVLASGLTFLFLSSSAEREDGGGGEVATVASAAPSTTPAASPPAAPTPMAAPSMPHPSPPVLTITPPAAPAADGGGGEGGASTPGDDDAGAADDGGGASPMGDAGPSETAAPTATPTPIPTPATPETEGGGGLPEEMVLPIDFERGRPTIIGSNRGELQRIADAIISVRRNRYELVGFASAEDMADEEDRRHLAARRARRALDLLRSLGPSSQRFLARAARSSESAPPRRASAPAESDGAVVLRLRGR